MEIFEQFKLLLFLAAIVDPLWLIMHVVETKAKKQREAKERRERERQRARHNELHEPWDQIVAGLLQNPTDVKSLQTALSFIKAHKAFRDCGYDMALDLVAASDAAKQNKVFALQVGRLRYSQHREDGVPTVYDEAAIENDIKARC